VEREEGVALDGGVPRAAPLRLVDGAGDLPLARGTVLDKPPHGVRALSASVTIPRLKGAQVG